MSLTPPVIAGLIFLVIVIGCAVSAWVWPERPLLRPFRKLYGTAPRHRGRGTDALDQPEFRRPTDEGDLL